MRQYIGLLVLLTLVISSVQGQTKRNDISLVISPIKWEEQSSYQLLYRRSLKSDSKWTLRAGFRSLVDTDKETRADSGTSTNQGTVQFDLSLGAQRKLIIENLDKLYLYAGSDGYLNSDFRRQLNETYYGYFWDFGFAPHVGLSYEPFKNIRF